MKKILPIINFPLSLTLPLMGREGWGVRVRVRPVRLKRLISLMLLFTFTLTSGTLIYLFGPWARGAHASWFNDNWAYRKSIAITAHTSAETNVYLNLTGGNALDTSDTTRFKANCGDLRFTDAGGNLLPYFISSGCGTSSTVIHVNFKSFPAGAQTIYYYYGNPSAPNGFSPTDFPNAASGVTIGSLGSEEQAPSPVAYWKFDDGTGTSAKDSSQYANTGTLTGTTKPTWQTEDLCAAGKCLYFDGITSNVSAASTVNSVKTISFWVKPATSSATLMQLTSNSTVYASSGTVSTDVIVSPSVYVNGNLNGTVSANQWNYITVTTATGITANSVILGKSWRGVLNGFMDEVKFYNFVRTSSQIQADYSGKLAEKGAAATLGGSTTDALNKGLVGYWKMDEASWNGTSGEVKDSSGLANNGTSTCTSCSVPSTTTGKFGNGGSFNGTSQEADVTSSTSLSPTAAITISAWVYPNSTTVTSGAPHEILQKNGAYGMKILNGGLFTGYRWFGPENHYSTTALKANKWYLVTMTFDGKKHSTYVNGNLEASESDSATIPNQSNTIQISNGSAGTFGGTIDEARIYNRALSADEVQQLYNFAPGPVGYWNFEEGTGSTVNDRSGNANTGTWNGTLGSQWTQGKFGKGGNFNGTNNFVSGTLSPSIANSSFTVDAWVNASVLGTTEYAFNLGSSGSQNNSLHLGRNSNNTITCAFYANDLFSTLTLPLGWHHVACTYDNITGKRIIYSDGVQVTSDTSASAFTGNTNYHIGNTQTATAPWTGKVDELRIYNYARTPSQIIQDMNAGHPLGGSPVGSQVGYFKFDEGYGTTAHNSGSDTSVGTLTNMATTPSTTVSGWTLNGKFGKALAFDGIDDYVSITGNPTAYQITNDLSISAWVNLTSNTAAHDIVSKRGATSNYGYRLSTTTAGNVQFEISSGTSSGIRAATGSATLSPNIWYHVTGVYNPGNSITVYVNGNQDGQVTTSIPASIFNSTQNVNIGADNAGASNLMSGYIDEVKIYSGQLTLQDIRTDYNRGSSTVLGSMSDTSGLTGGNVASSSASAEYCVPGDTSTCSAPVGRWDFEEGTGSTVNDTSGNGNTGTWNGTLGSQWTQGKFGKAGKFNGTDNYVSIPDASSMDTNTNFTISGWFKRSTLNDANFRSIYDNGTDANHWFVVLYSDYTLDFSVRFVADHHTTKTFNDANWHNFEIVKSGNGSSNLSIYIDGALESTHSVGALAASTGAKRIGDWTEGLDQVFKGAIDNVKLYNYARTASQVAWDYNRGAPIAWYKMDECQGTTIHDSSGNSNTGTLTIGASGTQTAAGTCLTPTDGTGAWYNGVNGKYNYSLNFDGVDDNVSVSNSISGVQFVGFWVKPATSSASLLQLTSNADVYASSGTVSTDAITSPTIYVNGIVNGTFTGGAWNHVVVTTGTAITANAVKLGKLWRGVLNGQLDDVRFYNYALTAAQIKLLYNQGSAVRYGPVTGSP